MASMTNTTRALVGATMVTVPVAWALVRGGETLVTLIAALAGTLIAIRAVWSFRHLRAGLRTEWWNVFLAGFGGALLLVVATQVALPGTSELFGGGVDELPWRPLLFILATSALLAGGITQLMMARRHMRLRSSVVSGRRFPHA